jgi:hydroxyethylthiazole kinase-like uncharacterized protein yjeF
MQNMPQNNNFQVMTRQQVRNIDDWAINTIGLPGVVLMENAGKSCSDMITQILKNKTHPRVSIFCGTGNNGGDGFVIARHLLNAGFKVSLAICGDRSKIKGDAKINLDVLEKLGFVADTMDFNADIWQQVANFTADSDMIVDAVFGTGLAGKLSDEYCRLFDSINQLKIPVLGVDIPSGLDCDTGLPLGSCVKADYTITFVAVKKGFTYQHAGDYTGKIFVASIGIVPPTA